MALNFSLGIFNDSKCYEMVENLIKVTQDYSNGTEGFKVFLNSRTGGGNEQTIPNKETNSMLG